MNQQQSSTLDMQARLSQACRRIFKQMRNAHKEWRSALRCCINTAASENNDSEAYWRGVLLQCQLDAVEIFDLYLEAQGKGRHAHFLKKNAQAVKKKETA